MRYNHPEIITSSSDDSILEGELDTKPHKKQEFNYINTNNQCLSLLLDRILTDFDGDIINKQSINVILDEEF